MPDFELPPPAQENPRALWAWVALLAGLAACSDAPRWECQITEGETPDFVAQIGCEADFLALASVPTTTTIPGARSVKTSIDREADGALSFQHSTRFPIHWDFLSEHRSVRQGLAPVSSLAQFNREEYYLPSRRFLLGALTHYEGPDK
jgi:hypothetical protein